VPELNREPFDSEAYETSVSSHPTSPATRTIAQDPTARVERATLALGGPTCSDFVEKVSPTGVEPVFQASEARSVIRTQGVALLTVTLSALGPYIVTLNGGSCRYRTD
jgi:hypothetical protein